VHAVVNTPNRPAPTAIHDVQEPAAKADQALVAVRAFSVNCGELALLATRPAGWQPGQDVAGVVAEAAADGAGPKPGTRVAGLVEAAGWSELVAVPTSRLAVLPEGLALQDAATLPLAGLTALRTLRLGGDLLGRRVLVTGASGAVGRFQIQLAAAAGAQVTAVARAAHAQQLLALGAERVIAEPAAADGSFWLLTESVGGASLNAAIAKVMPGGTVVVFGNTSGQPTTIGPLDFIGHEGARLVSFMSYASEQPFGPDLQLLVDLAAGGRLHATLGYTAHWSRVNDAIAALRQRRFSGKAVLTID
jgi:NADPH:quinone reductase-like Zn-dependent oxidoreductase